MGAPEQQQCQLMSENADNDDSNNDYNKYND